MSRMTTLQKKSSTTARRTNKRASAAVAPVAADAREAAVRYAGATREWAAPKVETAVDWAGPKVGTAKDWAAPRVEPAVEKMKSDVLPAVAGAVATALAATEPARVEAASRGSAALAALKGEVAPPRQSKHRIRKLFVLVSVLGAAYAGWKAWAARSSDPVDAWTTPVIPAATPISDFTAVDSPLTDDPAGASPDEVLADAAPEDPLDLTTTEPVTAAQSKKARDAAARGGTADGSTTT